MEVIYQEFNKFINQLAFTEIEVKEIKNEIDPDSLFEFPDNYPPPKTISRISYNSCSYSDYLRKADALIKNLFKELELNINYINNISKSKEYLRDDIMNKLEIIISQISIDDSFKGIEGEIYYNENSNFTEIKSKLTKSQLKKISNLFFNQNKKIKKLIIEIREKYDHILEERPQISSDLIWKKKPIDLVELIVALVESKSISTLQGDLDRNKVYKQLAYFFNFNLKNPEQNLSEALPNRSKSRLFLENLSNAFLDFRKRTLDKRDKIK